MKTKMKIATILLLLIATTSIGQNESIDENDKNALHYKHSIGASFFMLGNFLKDSPDYYLLTYGYMLNRKSRIFTEFNTWKYAEPLGTYGKSDEFYPGFVRAWGLGAGYQYFAWKGLFGTVQGTAFMKQYHDSNDEKTQKGFQLYVQATVGYRFNLFKDRWYIEPAFALKYWPINTNTPADFSIVEAGTPVHIFEPSLNFGFKF